MAFSPTVYGDRAAAMLNLLAEEFRCERAEGFFSKKFYTNTQPEGTPFEADILLSCSNIETNAVNSILRRMDPQSYYFVEIPEFIGVFFTDSSQYTVLVNEYNEACTDDAKRAVSSKIIESVLNAVLDIRRSIRCLLKPEEPSPTPAFSDTLFGPHVAKVMTSLLQVEIQHTENEITLSSRPEDRFTWVTVFGSLTQSSSLSDERKSFALRAGKGTAFAGDFLTLQYYRCGYRILNGTALPLIKDALFPEFEKDYKGEQNNTEEVNRALRNVREEIVFLTDVVHHEALPILMAGVHRLGRDSFFKDVDHELMRIMAHLVIFGAMPK
jgi:hypothetical protein